MDETRASTSIADRIVGVFHYRGIAAVTYHRLTMALDGHFTLDDWRDLGGRWREEARGECVLEGDVLRLVGERPRVPRVIEEPLGVRELDRTVVLVPQRYLSEFDETKGEGDASRRANNASFSDGYSLFKKERLPRVVVCGEPDVYGHALTRGKRYLVVQERASRGSVRIRADHGRLRWFPETCFKWRERE